MPKTSGYLLMHMEEPTFYASKSEIPKEYLEYLVDTNEFMGDDLKIVTTMRQRFYHFLFNTLATYLEQIELDSSASVIFASSESFEYRQNPPMGIDKVVEFYKKKLEVGGTKTYTLPTPNNEQGSVLVPVNNLRIVESLIHTGTDKLVIDYIRSFPELQNPWSQIPKVGKSVYCSRKYTNDTREMTLEDIKNFRDDDSLTWPRLYPRVDREEDLEESLSNKGVQISYPELFKSYEEQMEYYSNCNTLISTTSAGLLNMLYMPPGSTVIELYTELYGGGSQGHHDQYRLLSVLCGHNHVTLLNTTRSLEALKPTLDELWVKELVERNFR